MRRGNVPVENVAEIVWGVLLLVYLLGARRTEYLTPSVLFIFSLSGAAALLELFLRRARWRFLLLFDTIVWTILLSTMVAATGGRASELWPAYILMSLTAPSVERRSIPWGLLAMNCLLYAGVYTWVNPEHIHFNLSLLVLRIGMVFLVAYVVDRSMARERVAQLKAIEVAQSRVTELVSARDAERKLIASDIHDWLGTGIVAPMRRLELALRAKGEGELPKQVNEGLAMLRRSHDDLRRLMEHLHPHLLEQMGLSGGVRAYLRRWGEENGCKTEFHGEPGPEPPPEVALAIYRILQEALNNCAKHAHATAVSVRVILVPDKVTLVVGDDGQGFASPPPGGRGLTGMTERATVVGGSVHVTSRPAHGTLVSAEIPVRRR